MFSGSRCKSSCEMFCENLLCAVKRVLSGGGGGKSPLRRLAHATDLNMWNVSE